MARYLVGQNGFLKKTWGFIQALEAACDGDVIELEEGFSPFYEQNNHRIIISRSITIEGHLDHKGMVTNTIDGVVVNNGATVTLKNLEVRKAVDKSNNINVNGAILTAENVILTSYAVEGENYPVVYLSNGARASFGNSVVEPGNLHDHEYKVYAENSTLEVTDSTINARVYVSHSGLNIHNFVIHYTEANALYAYENSEITVSSSIFEGGYRTERDCWACIKLQDSKLVAKDMVVKQPDYDMAFHTINSTLTLNVGTYDSLYLEKSKASIGYICVVESFCIVDSSHVKAEGVCIVGKENGKINLFLNRKSSLESELVCFGRRTQPNVKAERDTKIKVESMVQAAYDPENWNFIIDEEGGLKKTGEASEIEYFGELPAFERLNQMIGINGVKQTVEEFVAIAELNKKREKQGLKNSSFSLHSMFLGNPGTGKTTVARLLGEILYEKEIISSKKFVETSRSDLVAEYLGQTAIKTRGVLESALGGVLFIDEAYTLCGEKNNTYKDYGTEAVDEILKFMEDHRQDIVLIFAGYTNSMEEFLKINEGLKSRIPNTFVFEDYTAEELFRIGLNSLYEQKYEIDEKAYRDLVYRKHRESNDNSNGRWVRNLNEKLLRKMALRVSRNPNASLVLITQEDIDAI